MKCTFYQRHKQPRGRDRLLGHTYWTSRMQKHKPAILLTNSFIFPLNLSFCGLLLSGNTFRRNILIPSPAEPVSPQRTPIIQVTPTRFQDPTVRTPRTPPPVSSWKQKDVSFRDILLIYCPAVDRDGARDAEGETERYQPRQKVKDIINVAQLFVACCQTVISRARWWTARSPQTT